MKPAVVLHIQAGDAQRTHCGRALGTGLLGLAVGSVIGGPPPGMRICRPCRVKHRAKPG